MAFGAMIIATSHGFGNRKTDISTMIMTGSREKLRRSRS